MDFIFTQFVGAIGYSILAFSYFKKEKRQILFLQILSYIMFTIHYYLLSGITGAICNFIGLLALVTIYLFDKNKWKYKNQVAIIFIFLLLVINIITFQNVFSIFPMVASVIAIISFLTDKEETIREIGIVAAICWLLYAIVYKSYIAIVFEVVTLIGVCAAYIKNNVKIESKERNKK